MIRIVYWSGTGNTEAMANAVADGVKNAGGEAEVLPVSAADESVLDGGALLLGCPAMGAEELEESEFEPFFSSVEGRLQGKKAGLFGSYDWGDGEWMRTWQAHALAAGAVLLADGVIAHNEPDAEAIAACEELGKKPYNKIISAARKARLSAGRFFV